VSVNQESLLDRHSELVHGVVLQKSQDPDELPESLSFFSFLPFETTAKSVKALGQIQIHERPGMIQGTRLSFQKRQVVEVVKEDTFLPPGSHVLCYHRVFVT
jgi:hypothetical protein